MKCLCSYPVISCGRGVFVFVFLSESNIKNKTNAAFSSDDNSWQAEAEIDMELFHQVGATSSDNTYACINTVKSCAVVHVYLDSFTFLISTRITLW